MKSLTVMFNGQSVIEYDRKVRLPGHQRSFLDKMDKDMDQGINLGEEQVVNPDQTQKAQYIAMHLVEAIEQDKDSMISALTSYLANRLSDLTQLRAVNKDGHYEMEFIFDNELQNQVAVQFDTNPGKNKTH